MTKCSNCNNNAIITTEKAFCKEHFVKYFEDKVISTITKFKLVSSNDKIIVASSGGKDSTTVLYILKKYFGKVEALAIDEGIPRYRSKTLEDLEKFCKRESIPLKIYSYKKEFDFSLNEALKIKKDLSPCYMCGVLRRYLLNTKARNFTKIATGHNLDDEAQSIMMNLVKSQIPLLARLGPITDTAEDKNFVPRIKPLYFCTEKEVATYAFVNNFATRFTQCPHSHDSFRAFVRDALNDYEIEHKGAKKNLVNNFLKLLPKMKSNQKDLHLNHCSNCGEPSSKELCKACSLVNSIANA
ncbi:TIGR00269 family protein [Candidatus Woesearchaeota archaeon]|nr:TIGR00269 family protein [Candidatus Woesearchaeota archaeon]|tara:strand:+ start:5345 stop:6238 length:894 start_codon:yes stop_codon:yes gene_type:complete